MQPNNLSATWEEFEAKFISESGPYDHVRLARDRVRRLHQTLSVANYLSYFRNVCLSIPGMNYGEMWDRFIAGLKNDVRLEVMKSTVTSFEDTANISLRVDRALWGIKLGFRRSAVGSSASGTRSTPTEIGSVESRGSGGGRKMEGQ